jgi:hypothetical protein
MNYCFHGWSNAGPLQADFIPTKHIPTGPPLIACSLLFSIGIVGVVVEVVPLLGDTVLLNVGLFLCELELSLLLSLSLMLLLPPLPLLSLFLSLLAFL